MSLEQSEAFILRTFKIGEQDKIVIFLTKDKGILKGIAKGARKFGNRFGSSLELLTHVKIFYYEKEHKELVVINNCDLIESYFELQRDIEKGFTLNYFSELIEEFFPSNSKDEILFRLLSSILLSLKTECDIDFLGAYFEVWILKLNGFLPSFKTCRKCRKNIIDSSWISPKKEGVYCDDCSFQKKEKIPREMKEFIEWVKQNPPSKHPDLPFPKETIKTVRKILQDIIVYHMEKEPKSLRFLR
jgi:DNA repair protein RecO (recombination protein O)